MTEGEARIPARIVIRHVGGAKIHRVEQLRLDRHSVLTLGRDRSSTIAFDAIEDKEVSRNHALITIQMEDPVLFTLADLASANGTYLNGRKITGEMEVLPGDEIQLGQPGPKFIFDVRPRPAGLGERTHLNPAVDASPLGQNTIAVPAGMATAAAAIPRSAGKGGLPGDGPHGSAGGSLPRSVAGHPLAFALIAGAFCLSVAAAYFFSTRVAAVPTAPAAATASPPPTREPTTGPAPTSPSAPAAFAPPLPAPPAPAMAPAPPAPPAMAPAPVTEPPAAASPGPAVPPPPPAEPNNPSRFDTPPSAATDGSGASLPAPDPSGCLTPEQIEDRDGDVRNNIEALRSRDLCIREERFPEGRLNWVLQIIEHRRSRDQILWVVPHDNEHAAFDTAVYGVSKHGGTVIAVETGGSRFNGPQDPNRNFDVGGSSRKCPQQIAPSPAYTNRFRQRLQTPDEPIIALHTNDRGFSGDGAGGAGTISMLRPLPGNRAYPAARPIPAASPNDTMVFVASLVPKERDGTLGPLVDRLNDKGINVMYEQVTATGNDCSFSHYAALNHLRNYFNVEVVNGDGETQKRIVDIIVQLYQEPGRTPPVAASPPPAAGTPTATASQSGATPPPVPSPPVMSQSGPPVPLPPSAVPSPAPPGQQTPAAAPPVASPAGNASAAPTPRRATTKPAAEESRFLGMIVRTNLDEQQAIKEKKEFNHNYANTFSGKMRLEIDKVNKKRFMVILGPFKNYQEMREYCKVINREERCSQEHWSHRP